ncbi:hypothetical protein AGMMS49975_05420 [Clostridia bacterium]|nr:hypothetical protein AGMMS49975_05420 [Clostridia bacterium]
MKTKILIFHILIIAIIFGLAETASAELHEADRAVGMVWGLAALGAVVSLVSLSVLVSSVGAVSELARAAKGISDGAEVQFERDTYTGEFSEIASNLKEINEHRKFILSGIDRLSNTFRKGDSFAPIDPNSLKGGYRDAANDLNELAVFIAKRREHTHRVCEDVKNGKFSYEQRLEEDYGYMCEFLSKLTKEVNKFAKNIASGNFSKMPESTYTGDWKIMAQSLNGISESVASNVKELSAVLRNSANGDFSGKISGDFAGDFAPLKDNFNSAAANVVSYTSDISSVLIDFANKRYNRDPRTMGGSFSAIREGLSLVSRELNDISRELESVQKGQEKMPVRALKTFSPAKTVNASANSIRGHVAPLMTGSGASGAKLIDGKSIYIQNYLVGDFGKY